MLEACGGGGGGGGVGGGGGGGDSTGHDSTPVATTMLGTDPDTYRTEPCTSSLATPDLRHIGNLLREYQSVALVWDSQAGLSSKREVGIEKEGDGGDNERYKY